MYDEVLIANITQNLKLARQRQKLDPRDTMETLTYIAHVERLLIELENAISMNTIQAKNIREYVRQQEAHHAEV